MRFWCDNNTNRYYNIVCLLSPGEDGMPEQQPCYGICDEDAGGYIAYALTQEMADRIVKALNGRS